MILVYTVFTPNSRPQVRKPIIRSMTFKIIVIADSGSGMKLDSTIPRPEILLTEVWLGTRKKCGIGTGRNRMGMRYGCAPCSFHRLIRIPSQNNSCSFCRFRRPHPASIRVPDRHRGNCIRLPLSRRHHIRRSVWLYVKYYFSRLLKCEVDTKFEYPHSRIVIWSSSKSLRVGIFQAGIEESPEIVTRECNAQWFYS